MRIIIKWLPQAIALLDNIYRFYSEKSQTAAIRLYNRLLDSAEPLRVFNNLHEATTKFLTIYFYIKNITNFVCLNESGRKFTAKAKQKQIE